MNTTSTDDADKKAIVLTTLLKGEFLFLRDHGYQLSGPVREQTRTFGLSFLWKFQNPEAEREFLVHYRPYAAFTGEPNDQIYFSIRRIPNTNGEFRPEEDDLDPDCYFRSKVNGFEPTQIRLNQFHGTFREKSNELLKLISRMLTDHAAEILLGKTWESGHIPNYL
jgi:hypothetical protein